MMLMVITAHAKEKKKMSKGKIIERYKREVISHPKGAVVHHGDCGLYDADLEICTCGLHHDLIPLKEKEIKEIYPKFYEELNGDTVVRDLMIYLSREKLYLKTIDEYELLTKEKLTPTMTVEECSKWISDCFEEEN